MTDLSTPYVYPNQQKAWAEVEALVDHNATHGKTFNRVILLAQPQVGKTSFMIWGSIQRAKKAKELGVAYRNMIVIADANNALREQTKKDLAHALKCAGLEAEAENFIVEHRAQLKYVPLPVGGMLTVFIDEAHIAARTGGARDDFQRTVYDYPNGDRLLVDVGATSFAHVALHEDTNSPYDKVVLLDPGPAYNSVEHMYDQGRIRQVERLADLNGNPSLFLGDRVATLKHHGGYTLIRATGKRHVAVLRALRELSPSLRIIEADMFKEAVLGKHLPIAKLPALLCHKPKQPTVVMVRGALRVGIVLPPQASANICEMIDTNAMRADTVTQSFVGRSCGYHKRNDTYGIFTNLKDIETVLDFYHDVKGAIPLGLKNTGAKRSGSYAVVPFEKAHQLIKDEQALVSRCSLNNENDVADHVRRGVNTWDKRLVLIDKPNPKFSQSWQLLVAYRPELIGNYVTYSPDLLHYAGAEIHDNFIDLDYMVPEEFEEAEAA